MCESIESGYHSPSGPLVNAQTIPDHEKPPETCGSSLDEAVIVVVQESLEECPAEHEQDGQDQKPAHGHRPPGVSPAWSRAG